jgi:hypothetical protein
MRRQEVACLSVPEVLIVNVTLPYYHVLAMCAVSLVTFSMEIPGTTNALESRDTPSCRDCATLAACNFLVNKEVINIQPHSYSPPSAPSSACSNGPQPSTSFPLPPLCHNTHQPLRASSVPWNGVSPVQPKSRQRTLRPQHCQPFTMS